MSAPAHPTRVRRFGHVRPAAAALAALVHLVSCTGGEDAGSEARGDSDSAVELRLALEVEGEARGMVVQADDGRTVVIVCEDGVPSWRRDLDESGVPLFDWCEVRLTAGHEGPSFSHDDDWQDAAYTYYTKHTTGGHFLDCNVCEYGLPAYPACEYPYGGRYYYWDSAGRYAGEYLRSPAPYGNHTANAYDYDEHGRITRWRFSESSGSEYTSSSESWSRSWSYRPDGRIAVVETEYRTGSISGSLQSSTVDRYVHDDRGRFLYGEREHARQQRDHYSGGEPEDLLTTTMIHHRDAPPDVSSRSFSRICSQVLPPELLE